MSVEIIKDDRKNWDKIIAEIRKFKKSYVKVGVLESTGTHESESGSAIPMVMVASVHEFGLDIKVTDKMRGFLHFIGVHLKKETEVVRIPERSFIRKWADEESNKVREAITKLLDTVATGKYTARQALNILGAMAESGIKNKFRDNDWKPLKFRSGSPLIDTGQLRSSIHHQVMEID